MRGATLLGVHSQEDGLISTHAPRAGSDVFLHHVGVAVADFNPRSPCGERPPCARCSSSAAHFNPRSPCGERLRRQHVQVEPVVISTHAPRAGSDGPTVEEICWICISTHAPRAGSDPCGHRTRSCGAYFNPRSPCGERPGLITTTNQSCLFQPTLPVRGATCQAIRLLGPVLISTHAPRAGSDVFFWRIIVLGTIRFQPTLPVRGATRRSSRPRTRCRNFNPRSPCGERPSRRCLGRSRCHFNPRSPCGERPQYIALIVFCCQYADQRRAIGPEKQAARTSKRPNAVRTSPVTLGSLMFAPQTTAPKTPRLHTSVSRPRALSSFDTCCPDNRIASCPSQGR